MSSYSDVVGHASMVFDHVRNLAYEKAILSKVTSETVVLDLGAGLGLHGLMAARAGAKKVYLVDPSPVVFAAEQVAKENGLNNVVCIQSRLEDLELDEKVDLIISVFTGNFMLTEDLLPSLFLARKRFLNKGGNMIPERGRMLVVPVSMEDYHRNNVSRWGAQEEGSLEKKFGVDYSAIQKYADNYMYYDDFSGIDWSAIAPEKELTEINFLTAEKAESFDRCEFTAQADMNFHGWLGWFDMLLGEEWLSTSPKVEKLHWSQVFLPTLSVQPVQEGDSLSFELKRPEYGDWTWKSSPGSDKSQTTFLTRPLRANDIQKQSPRYSPELSEDGQILRFILGYFDGANTVDEIAQKLVESFPRKFSDPDKAIRFVQQQVRIFS